MTLFSFFFFPLFWMCYCSPTYQLASHLYMRHSQPNTPILPFTTSLFPPPHSPPHKRAPRKTAEESKIPSWKLRFLTYKFMGEGKRALSSIVGPPPGYTDHTSELSSYLIFTTCLFDCLQSASPLLLLLQLVMKKVGGWKCLVVGMALFVSWWAWLVVF